MLDRDNKNSTFSEIFKKKHPEHFIECFIAGQNMMSMALGCTTRGQPGAFTGTFAAFLIWTVDQIWMGAIFQTSIDFIGSHCRVFTGEDGSLQMALEDLAMFQATTNCTIFSLSDTVSMDHAVFLVASIKGMCYIWTSHPETAIIYEPQESFEIGQAKVIRHIANDKVTVLELELLDMSLSNCRGFFPARCSFHVIDLFTVKPLVVATIISNAKSTGDHIITVEGHHPESSIREAISAVVSMEPDILVYQLAVSGVPCGQSN